MAVNKKRKMVEEEESLEMKPERAFSHHKIDSETQAVNGSHKAENSSSIRSVLVVGAGPAGLMLASNLVRFGINVEIIDDRECKTATGRADGLQPKTIETFRQLRLVDGLLRNGVKIYDICFWNSTPTSPMSRTSREVHYPPSVDTLDPYVLLVHQGMIEDVFLGDLKSHGIEVIRSSSFIKCGSKDSNNVIESTYQDTITGQTRTVRSNYVIGCDGAHSQVRKSMPGVTMKGQSGNAAWGVLDGVIETNFPDMWSKAVIHSETTGSMLIIPRERNMTRLYIELHPSTKKAIAPELANEDFVMRRAAEILHPFYIRWKRMEWFSVYRIGQRIASTFAHPSQGLFIVGDAAHTHSPKAAQGMNVSMHDSFNLAWKLNLVLRNIASSSLLDTYELERKQIAQELIAFDFEHANAFLTGDAQALARNFDDNIRFISGVGAEYSPNMLNQKKLPSRIKSASCLQPGAILTPARVTRYIDANPVDIQLDIPLISQFRIYFFVSDIYSSMLFLRDISDFLISDDSVMWRASKVAEKSYDLFKVKQTAADEYLQPNRYNGLSKLFTPALVTTMEKERVEIKDLPLMFRSSPWTFYLDDVGSEVGACTNKWLGELEKGEVAIVNVRPDGYIGSIALFGTGDQASAKEWIDGYYREFLNG